MVPGLSIFNRVDDTFFNGISLVLQTEKMALIKKTILFITLTVSFYLATAQQKIIVYDLKDTLGTMQISNKEVVDSVNVSDQRPVFIPDRNELCYLKDTGTGSSIMVFDSSRTSKTLIESPDKLYAINLTPDHEFISSLMNTNGVMSLVKFPLVGGQPITILNDVKIENYIWLDDNSLIITEPGKPNSLQLLTLRPQKKIPVAVNVGQTLVRSEKLKSYAFVHKLSVDTWNIKILKPDGNIEIAMTTLPEAEIFTLLPDASYLMVSEGMLYISREKHWQEVKGQGTESISQVETNESKTKLAVIASDVK